MNSIAFIIPKEYITPDMSQQLKRVYKLSNGILENMRTPPSYEYKVDGRKLFQYTTKNTVHSSVIHDYLQTHMIADPVTFNDALTLLQMDKYISVSNDIITLLPAGNMFIVGGGYDYGQNEPEPEIEWELKDGIYLPKPQSEEKKEIPLAFKAKLTVKQRAAIVTFLKEHKLVNKPSKFVAFLNGENDGSGIEVNDGEHNLAAITHLLQKLYEDKKIQLNATKAFQKHFTSHIRPFSIYTEKEQVEMFKKEVRKATNSKWLKCPLAKSLEETISSLIAAGVAVIVIYP